MADVREFERAPWLGDVVRMARSSASQQQLYALVSRFPRLNVTYNVCEAFRIRGDLDVASLRAGVATAVSRHEALRTSMFDDGVELRQAIRPCTPGAVRVVDLPSAPDVDPERVLADVVRQDCDTPFRLAEDRLARFTLYRVSPGDHVLVFVVHHLVFDGWSLELLWREISELYRAARRGVASDLPAVTLQFGDYVELQRAWLCDAQAAGMLDFWLDELSGCPEGPTLPYDDGMPLAPGGAGLRQRTELSATFTADLVATARSLKVTPAAVVLLAWQLLIGRLTKVPVSVVGIPMSNRMRVATLGTMGCLVNTHAIPLALRPDASLRDMVLATSTKLMAAVVNQEMPLPVVLDTAAKGEAPGLPRRPYRTMFTFQDQPTGQLPLLDLEVENLAIEQRTRKADTTLHAGIAGERLVCELEYSTACYRAETAAVFLAAYTDILRRIVTSPDEPCAAVLDA